MVKSTFFTFMLLLGSFGFLAAQGGNTQFWSDIAERNITPPANVERVIFPKKFRTVSIDTEVLATQLSTSNTGNGTIVLDIPLPDGTSSRFEVWPAQVMHPDLQAKYPEIQCFTGKGLDDPSATIKCDFTPWGFHAMILSSTIGTVYMDPYFHGEARTGMVYFKKDFQKRKNDVFECAQVSEASSSLTELTLGAPAESQEVLAGDCKHRQYRLALSCTGEYATFHGGTKPLVLAAMNTSMNRVNGLYEKDFAISMQIIPNNDTLIFLNASTDPFTNNNGSTMLGQNQTTVTQRIGSANYDIGHVFSTGGGGIAQLGAVCSANSKARGVTGSGAPVGDPFDIDYVAHEMGHQFGGNHCYNNSCGGNRNDATAMEPGSGSTIMAYAGICSPNVQNNSDDYFHAINIQEIVAFAVNGSGNSCAVKTVTGNTGPTVNNVPNYNIPKSTPFALTAPASDVDAGDVLTWCWEQMDAQIATMPPVATSTGGPLFRSYDPVASPTRYFPRLPDLVANTTNQWEKLPSVARTMNFRVVVRDNHPGGGCTAEDNVQVVVSGTAGPFVVSVPNTNVIWYVGETQTVTWNVAGTDASPVNCANVRILLSTDGGYTYPVVLAENVPNNGSAVVTVPNNIATTCRVKVESVGNVFYDISNTNFRIQAPVVPTFVLASSASAGAVCSGETASFSLTATSLAGFTTPADIVITGAPAADVIQISQNPLTPTGTATVTISNLTPEMAGVYPLTITATAGAIVQTATYTLTVFPGAPASAVTALTPVDSTVGVPTTSLLSWAEVAYATNYTVEICANPAFAPASAVISLTSDTTQIAAPASLSASTPYYWRVRASNSCGTGTFSATAAFQTNGGTCNQVFSSTNVPVLIDANGGPVNVSSVLAVAANGSITDVNVSVDIAHTWLGDLDASLQAPNGTTIALFNRPGEPGSDFGCGEDDLVVVFDDESTNSADLLEATCEAAIPSIAGTFNSIDPLSGVDGSSATGNWTLLLNDSYPGEDEGQINNWSLTFCLSGTLAQGQVISNNVLSTVSGTTKVLPKANLEVAGTSQEVVYTLLSTPQSGSLRLNGTALALGDQFTQTDINAGVVTYVHGGNTATTDEFRFDVLNTQNSGWIHNQVFHITILQNTLTATATQTTAVSCYNGTDGQLTVATTGGTDPLTFSLNGAAGQSSNVFTGLASGSYTIVVKDANGFTQTASVELANPTAVTVSTTVSANDLTVTATGGSGVYEYSVDGINFQASGVFSALSDGIYTATVRDGNGCAAETSVIVSSGTLLATIAQTSQNLCFGQQNAALTVTVAGGIPPYSYSLNGGAPQESNVFAGLGAGTYTVDVQDAINTTITNNMIVVGQPALLEAMSNTSLNVVTTTVTGGTSPYSFSLNGGAAQSSGVFGSLSNGDYTVVVTDANGCSSSASANVNVPALVIVDVVSENVNPCTGMAGTLTAFSTGGIPPYEYRLDGGAWQSSASFENVSAGVSHMVEVRDAVNTIVSNAFVITAPTTVAASVTVSAYNAIVVAQDGAAPYTYSLNGGAAQDNGNFTDLANGSYAVVVTDANGCTDEVTFTVNYTPLGMTFVGTNITCAGLSDGSIVVTAQGGTPPYSFSSNPFPLVNLAAGTYTVTVTDALGDVRTSIITLTEPDVLGATINHNGSGTVTVIATGGTTPYNYSLDGGATYQTSPVFTNVVDGVYTVMVRDANDCTVAIDDLQITGAVEVATQWGVKVAPNPTSGLFRLEIGQAPKGDLQLVITDATGRQVQTRTFEITADAFQTVIDLNETPAGMYFLHLISGNNSGALRIIKQ